MSLRHLLLFCSLFVCASLSAQQKKKDTATMNVPGTRTELPCEFKYDYSIADSTRIFDGAFSLNGTKDENGIKESYSLSGFASRNQMDGDLEASYSLEGVIDEEKHYLVFNYKGSFEEGLPHGAMTIRSFGQGSSAYDVSMNFTKGVLTGKISFKAFAKKEFMLAGNFTSEGEMVGEWKTGRYDVKNRQADRQTFTISDGIKISGTGYTTELEQEAKKYKEGKISQEQLKAKGITVRTIKETDLEEVIKNAVRNRFIPFDSLATADVSKIRIEYKALAYFPCLNEEGFSKLLTAITDYNGYANPDLTTFGIAVDATDGSLYKTYSKSEEPLIKNPQWDNDSSCRVFFSKSQTEQLVSLVDNARKKWRNGSIAICRSNMETLMEQYLLHKTPVEISTLMAGASQKGYKVDSDHSAARYQEHAPIVGFENVSMEAAKDSTAAHVFVSRINVRNIDSLGYRTYEWYIRLRSTDPKDLLNDVNDSFSAENFTRVGNQYDTINNLISRIDRNSETFRQEAQHAMTDPIAEYIAYIRNANQVDDSDLEGSAERLRQVLMFQNEFDKWMKKSIEVKETDTKIRTAGEDTPKIMDGYSRYLKHADLSWSPENNLDNLNKLEEIQDNILKYIECSCIIAENNRQIRKHASRHDHVVGEYKKFLKKQDLKWSAGADLHNLDTLIAIQNKTQEFLSRRDSIELNHTRIERRGKDYDVLKEAYHKYIKDADMDWTPDVDLEKLDSILAVQNRTLEFISLRNWIVENHETLLKEGKRYKRVMDAYSKYAKDVDVAWTPEVDLQKLQAIISVQDSCKVIFSMQDKKGVNRTLKKEKLKNIADIIEKLIQK